MAKSTKTGGREPSDQVISEVMAALGRRGGKVKGAKGFATLSKAERTAKAAEGARARWAKKKGKGGK